MQQPTIKLLIANDQQLYRNAQELAISKVPHLQIIGVAVSFKDLFEKLRRCCPSILIADDVMFNEKLLDYILAIKILYPALKIIATSNYDDPNYLMKLRHVAHGLLVGGAITAEEFTKAIEMVSNGENCYWHQYMWHNKV